MIRRRASAIRVAAGLLVMAMSRPALAASEYDVKAAFLYNFAKFVDWPPSSLPAAAPFTLCLTGPNPFGAALAAIEGKPVAGHPLSVRIGVEPEQAAGCLILFIGGNDIPLQRRVLDITADRPVLTVADAPGFTERGGIINFVVTDRRVQFAANPRAARRAGLLLRAYLLKVAIVATGQE